MKTLTLILALCLSAPTLALAQDLPPRPRDFAKSGAAGLLRDGSPDPLGGLTLAELQQYIIKRDDLAKTVDLRAFLGDDLTFQPASGHSSLAAAIDAKLRGEADKRVGKIQEHFVRHFPSARDPAAPDRMRYPVSVTEVEAFDGSAKRYALAEKVEAEQARREATGAPPKTVTHEGIRLRKSADKWKDDRDDAPGAVFSLLDDYKKNKKSVTAEGALIYPLAASTGEWLFVPSVNWKHVRIDDKPAATAAATATTGGAAPAAAAAAPGPKDGEVNELQFNFALVTDRSIKGSDWWSNSRVEYSPYYLTDTDLKGRLFGLTLAWIPSLNYKKPGPGNRPVNTAWALNHGYRSIPDTPLRYRVGAVPGIDFNYLDKTSPFLGKAERGSYLRFTGKVELGLKTLDGRFELLGSYRWFSGISGPTAWSEHASLSAKWWLNDYAGLSLERQKGETPVADKEINALTLGFEVKY